MARQEGVTLGPYRVVEQVGVGGMATVYKAYQPSMERYVALKILPQHYARDPKFVERFIREARTIARLEHRNILPVHDFGEQDGTTYLAMRFLEGGTLKDILQLGRLTLSDASELLSQVAAALDYAHQQGVIHRDVKPANIMVDDDGWAYLTDFGIAKALEGTSDLTQGVLGTPSYMAPEQSMGEEVGAHTDIYALGIILYEMVTGRVPYEADTPMAVALAHVHSPLPMPREIDPSVPEPIERVILKAVAKAPEDRYQSAGEFATALQEAIAEAEVDASQTHIRALAGQARDSFISQSQQITRDDFAPGLPPTTQPAPAPAKPKRWPLVVGILAAVVIIGGAIVALLLTGILSGATPTPADTDSDTVEQAAQPTPTQEIIAAPDRSGEPLYDDFSTTGSGFDKDKWDFLSYSAPECLIERTDGVGIFSNQPAEEFMACDMEANRDQVPLEDFGFIEADLYAVEDASGTSATLGFQLLSQDIGGGFWLAACGLQSYGTGQPSAIMYIEQQQDGTEYWEGVEVSAQEWHRMRLEADPLTAEISCYVDDRLIGRHLPKDADLLQNANFAYELVSWYEPGVTGTFWVDNVQLPEQVSVVSEPLEYVEGKVLFEDDFEDGSNDGWSPDSSWIVVQDETGNFVLQGTGPYFTYAGSEDWTNYALEVSIRVAESETQEYTPGISIAFRDDGRRPDQDGYIWNLRKDGAQFGQSSNVGWQELAFDPGFQMPIDTWMTVRIEAFDDLIRGYVDGQLILEITDSEPLLNGDIGFSPAPTNTVWFDDVRVVELVPASEAAEAAPDGDILFRDDFDATTLDDSWSWVREAAASWNLTDQPGSLTLMTGNTYLLNKGGDSPLLLRVAPGGDFELRTKLDLTPTQNYQAALIVIYQDDDNYVALGRAFCDNPGICIGDGVYLDDDHRMQTEGVYPNHAGGLPVGQPVYLRLIKKGTTYTGMWSADGETWNLVAETTATMSSPRIGLFTSNGRAGSASIPAVFDFFEVRQVTD